MGKWVTGIFLLVLSHSLIAQDSDNQLWINYKADVFTTRRISVGGDAGIRGLISNQDWNQFLIRPTATYRFSSDVNVSGAAAWFYTRNKEVPNVNELRFHQEANGYWPDLGFILVRSRLRLEERFLFYGDESLDNEIEVRFRYLLGFETMDIYPGNSKRPIYFQGLYEGFAGLGNRANEAFVNRNRVYAVFAYRRSNNITLQFQYIYQRSRLVDENGERSNENVFRLKVVHRLSSNSNSKQQQQQLND